MSEAARAARHGRKTGTAGRAPTNEATHTAMGTNRVVLGHRPRRGGAENGGREEKSDVEEEETMGAERDIMMAEAEIATTTESEIEAGALATND